MGESGGVLPGTGTPVAEGNHQVSSAVSGRVGKFTLTIDRSQLTLEDKARLLQAQRNQPSSE